jgi:predicted house-cleaning NTP pyrophosphatase (Maf/HAM1 superfamily)
MELPIQIVLASKSPRRVDLLTQLLDHEFGEGVVTFAIDPPNIDESPLAHETPIAHVQRLAVAKSHAVAARYNNAVVIVAADTTVDLDGKIFGQPADEQDARTMLSELSGRTHHVHTAVAVVHLPSVVREVVAPLLPSVVREVVVVQLLRLLPPAASLKLKPLLIPFSQSC